MTDDRSTECKDKGNASTSIRLLLLLPLLLRRVIATAAEPVATVCVCVCVAYTAESRWSFEDITTDEDEWKVETTAAPAAPERISVSAVAVAEG